MTPDEARTHLASIREVIARSKVERARSGDIYLVWGVLLVAADLCSLALPMGWIAFPIVSPIGAVYSVWSGMRSHQGVRTYGGRIEARLWIATGVACGGALVSAAVAGLVPLLLLVPLICAAAAVGMAVSGVVFDERRFDASAALFAAVAIAGPWMPLAPQHLAFDAVILVTYVLPAALGWRRAPGESGRDG